MTTLATQLVASYGRSFESRNLRRMMQFAKQFPDFGIVSALTTQLSWTHVGQKTQTTLWIPKDVLEFKAGAFLLPTPLVQIAFVLAPSGSGTLHLVMMKDDGVKAVHTRRSSPVADVDDAIMIEPRLLLGI